MTQLNLPILEITKLYTEGASVKDLCIKYSCSKQSILRFLHKNNIKSTKFNYKFKNERFFEVIDSEEKAYFLGLVTADGSINSKLHTLQINQIESNSYLLEILNNLLYLDRDLRLVFPKKDTHQVQKQLTATSKNLVLDLEKYNIVQNKSVKNMPINLDLIPKNLIRHFIRGIFDGDGCIHYNKNNKSLVLSIVGSTNVLFQIKNILQKGNIYFDSRSPKYTGIFSVGGNLQMKDIFEFLYKDATVFLINKKNKFVALYGDIH